MAHIQEFINYLSLEKNYSEHTVNAYMKDVLAFQEFNNSIEKTNIDLLPYSFIRNWLVYLSSSGVSNRSINRKIASLKSYYKFLLKIEVIKVSPLTKHKALKVDKKVQIPFSIQEMNKLLEEFTFSNDFEGVRNQFIIELLYATGVRKAELINLKLSDISVNQATIKVLGKRNKERIIPLTDKVIVRFKEYLDRRSKLPEMVDAEFVFLTKRGMKIYDTLVYRIINLYFSMVSSKFKKSPHVVRHTFATHLLNEGADLNAVKELLGHTSLAATQVYTHNSMAKLKEVYGNSHPRNQKN